MIARVNLIGIYQFLAGRQVPPLPACRRQQGLVNPGKQCSLWSCQCARRWCFRMAEDSSVISFKSLWGSALWLVINIDELSAWRRSIRSLSKHYKNPPLRYMDDWLNSSFRPNSWNPEPLSGIPSGSQPVKVGRFQPNSTVRLWVGLSAYWTSKNKLIFSSNEKTVHNEVSF